MPSWDNSDSLPNPRGVLVCCLGCGRDTKSKFGYCTDCRGGFNPAKARGVPNQRNLRDIDGDPADDRDTIDNESDTQYHGDHLD